MYYVVCGKVLKKVRVKVLTFLGLYNVGYMKCTFIFLAFTINFSG